MRGTIALALLAVVACGETPSTAVSVLFGAQGTVRARAANLRVRVWADDGELARDEVYPVITERNVRIDLRPRGGDATRRWRFEAELLDAEGAAIAVARRSGAYVEGVRRELPVCFTRPCLDAACDPSGCLTGGPCTTCDPASELGQCVPAAVPPVNLRLPGEVTPDNLCPTEPDCVVREEVETDCTNGEDDDCDALFNCEDDDCAGRPCGPGAIGTCAEDGSGTCVCNGESPETDCANGIDDDCDGAMDCEDPDCGTGSSCGPGTLVCDAGRCVCPDGELPRPEVCNDGLDNDCDGLSDCADALDCRAGSACGLGLQCLDDASCGCLTGDPDAPEDCTNGVDDDCDGQVDCRDPDCPVGASCGTESVCNGVDCVCADGREPTPEDCTNRIDDDCDGQVDCRDPDCLPGTTCRLGTTATCQPDGGCRCPGGTPDSLENWLDTCHDGADNDCDGDTDCSDRDCQGNPGWAEGNCRDAIDNDCDGRINCEDAGDCTEICGNGVDDDCDGWVDCQQEECCGASHCANRRIEGDLFRRCCRQPGGALVPVDVDGDDNHCGACGVRCGAGHQCELTPGGTGSSYSCTCTRDRDCIRGQDCQTPMGRTESRCRCSTNSDCRPEGGLARCIVETGGEYNYCLYED